MSVLTYRKSGVNIDRADAFVESIKSVASSTHRPEVLKGIGGFGAFFKLAAKKFKNPVLVSSADGVGTKIKCALATGRFDVLGEDLVGMNVNDILTCGAEPLFFLDYVAIGRIEPGKMHQILKGIARGCVASGCSLIGGETAEMPGIYKGDDFDLAGFAVGIVEENRILTGESIREGDAVVGLASNGLHSNGFSLVRKIFPQSFIIQHADEIMRPTRIYVKPVLKLLKHIEAQGMAHITGGAFIDKIPRILPKGKGILIHAGSWRVPRVFKWLQEQGNVPFKEMYRTFNMGIGFVVVTRPGDALRAMRCLAKSGVASWVIGRVTKGGGVTIQ